MNKRFTLIELVVVIVVIAILLSIVTINVLDFKKQSIRTAIQSNTTILQTASDLYYLENEEYPTKGDSELTISNPQEIDIAHLVKNRYVKKDLNLRVIKTQYYWVDAFGKVWGSANDATKEFTYHSDKNNKQKLDFKLKGRAEGFSLYQLDSKSTVFKNATEKEVHIGNLTASKGGVSSPKYTYKKVGEWNEVAGSKINIEIPSSESHYLISTIDEYGLESAPFGENRNTYFSPIYKGEGHYYFEISGVNKMHWVDFWALIDTPADSKVEFKFSTQSEVNGDFGEQIEDYYALEDAYGIQVHIYLTAGLKGEKPSVIDVNVLFNLEKNKIASVIENPVEESILPTCETNCIGYQVVSNGTSGSQSTGSKGSSSGQLGGGNIGNQPNESGGISVGSGNSSGKEFDNEPVSLEKLDKLCGPNAAKSTETKSVYSMYLSKGESIESISTANFESYGIKVSKLTYEFSHNKQPFELVESIYEIPAESCINIIIEFEMLEIVKYRPQPPIIIVGEENYPIIYKDKGVILQGGLLGGSNSTGSIGKTTILNPTWNSSTSKPQEFASLPNENTYDTEVNSDNWITVDKIRFFGLSGDDNTQWTGWEKDDIIPENTRILYRFSYHVNGSWTNELEEFQVRNAKNVVVTAYLQVSIYERDNANREEPSIKYVKLTNHSQGEVKPPYEKEVITSKPNYFENPSTIVDDFISKTIYHKKKNWVANIGYYMKSDRLNSMTFVQAGYESQGELVHSKEKYGFEKQFGGSKSNRAYGGTFDDEGNIYVVGASTSRDGDASKVTPKSNEYSFIYKLNPYGELVWWKNYLGNSTGNNDLRDATLLPNGNILAVGNSNSKAYYTVEIDSDGKVISENGYAFGDYVTPLKVVADKDKNIFILAVGGNSSYLIKINPDKKVEFQISLGGKSISYLYSNIMLTSDGDIVFGGTLECTFCTVQGLNFNANAFRGMVFKRFTSDGTLVWETARRGNASTEVRAFNLDDKNNVILLGYSNSNTGQVTTQNGTNNIFIAKINSSNGDFEYQFTNISKNYEIRGLLIFDKKILITGQTRISSYYATKRSFTLENPY